MRNALLLFIVSIFASCSPYSTEIERTLQQAGDNRAELERVLEYYAANEGDSLKLRAAEFLIGNMYWHTNVESEELDKFYAKMESINALRPDSLAICALEDSLYKTIEPTFSDTERKFDSQVITADFLIGHIDRMFEVRDSALCKDVPFEVFCEYVLPYRVLHEATNRPWVDAYRTKGKELIAQNREKVVADDQHLSDRWVRAIKRNYHVSSTERQEMTEGYPPSYVMTMKRGTCLDYANRGCYYFRSLGIPVAIDFLLEWGTQHGGHQWTCMMMDSLGNYSSAQSDFSMSGSMDERQGHHLENQRSKGKGTPKIYRYTFSPQANSLAMRHNEEKIPDGFSSPLMQDVTADYLPNCVDVEFQIPNSCQEKVLYLSVFDNRNWKPVAWADVIGRECTFKAVCPDIVYMLTAFDGEKMQSRGMPFLLCDDGSKRFFDVDEGHTGTVHLKRKYRITERVQKSSVLLGGGRLELANDSTFAHPYVICTFPDTTEVCYHYVKVETERKFRYARFIGQEGKHGGEIAEMAVYDQNGMKITGRAFSNQYIFWKQPAELAFDGDPLTYYRTGGKQIGFCAIDFGQPMAVSEIAVLPRNDGNFIEEGDLYELDYWNDGHWISLGKKHGTRSQVIDFDNVPRNALLLLHDLTKGREERIFTYEDGKQIWY